MRTKREKSEQNITKKEKIGNQTDTLEQGQQK